MRFVDLPNRRQTLQEMLPVGSEVRVRVGLLQGKIVDHVCLAMWPTTTEDPPAPGDPDGAAVDPAVIGNEVQTFLRASDRLESLVAADFNGLSDPNLQPAKAEVSDIFDDNYGRLEVVVGGDRGDRFGVLFHREDVYLRDGKRAIHHEFFKDKPLGTMVKQCGRVNLISLT